jgi:monoamine oxidase
MWQAAVVGGGPGGLFTAHLLERKLHRDCEVTIFEASARVGGKVLTRGFDSAPVLYEAGVAGCYDFESLGRDPLTALVEELGLRRIPKRGGVSVLEGRLLRDEEGILRQLGSGPFDAIERFRRRAVSRLPRESGHAGSRRNARPDFLLDVSGSRRYSIEGGMERLPRRLLESFTATRVKLQAPVVGIERTAGERYRVRFRRGRETRSREFDAVFVALPHACLGMIEWSGQKLRRAMSAQIAHYDRPAHYLRVSMLFEKPFWRRLGEGSPFTLDSFGGTSVDDASPRHDCGGRGVLGFLLAGSPALSLGNLDDGTLCDRILESLPDDLFADARGNFLESKVHRWAGAVSAQPGGVRDARAAHRPEAEEHPRLFLVGDYLFDSTLNGVYDSADLATDLMVLPARTEMGAGASVCYRCPGGRAGEPHGFDPSRAAG